VAISAPRFGEKVGELLALPRGLRHWLKAKVRNHPGSKALPLFDSHGVESTAIGIDAN
jgi:cupin superfamily acireductone dioxygenase involved in methionine salvage